MPDELECPRCGRDIVIIRTRQCIVTRCSRCNYCKHENRDKTRAFYNQEECK